MASPFWLFLFLLYSRHHFVFFVVKFKEAHQHYLQAIEYAQTNVDKAKGAEAHLKAVKTLSSRMGNHAVCYMQQVLILYGVIKISLKKFSPFFLNCFL